MSTLSKFIHTHKPVMELIKDEAEAIVNSGATGAHTDQARKNWLIAAAFLELIDNLSHLPKVNKASAAKPVSAMSEGGTTPLSDAPAE